MKKMHGTSALPKKKPKKDGDPMNKKRREITTEEEKERHSMYQSEKRRICLSIITFSFSKIPNA